MAQTRISIVLFDTGETFLQAAVDNQSIGSMQAHMSLDGLTVDNSNFSPEASEKMYEALNDIAMALFEGSNPEREVVTTSSPVAAEAGGEMAYY